jgi:hypothetical protein
MKKRNTSPKTTTKDPRVAEARRLRMKGATDDELRERGFSPREISRAFMPNSFANHARCGCGAFAVLDEYGVCSACRLLRQIGKGYS